MKFKAGDCKDVSIKWNDVSMHLRSSDGYYEGDVPNVAATINLVMSPGCTVEQFYMEECGAAISSGGTSTYTVTRPHPNDNFTIHSGTNLVTISSGIANPRGCAFGCDNAGAGFSVKVDDLDPYTGDYSFNRQLDLSKCSDGTVLTIESNVEAENCWFSYWE